MRIRLHARLFADLIGKPFVRDARGPDAFDCVGLAVEMARRLGRQVPDYVSSHAELHRCLTADHELLADCPRLAGPEPGAVVLLRMPSSATSPFHFHLGVMVDGARMLHTTETTGCVIERLDSPAWARRVLGFYSIEGRA